MSVLSNSAECIEGVGRKRLELLGRLGISTVGELLEHYPRSYLDLRSPVEIENAVLGEMNVIRARVTKKLRPDLIRKNMRIFRVVLTDGSSDITAVIYNSVYSYNRLVEGKEYILYGRVEGNLTARTISAPMILTPGPGCGILPVYPLTKGITDGMLRVWISKALCLAEADSIETLPEDAISRLGLVARLDAVRAIHFPNSPEEVQAARRRLGFEELLVLQLGMARLRRKNRTKTAYRLEDKSLSEFLSALPFEPTKGQLTAIRECCQDMTRGHPMNRLILGDVGSGKTAVAAAACFFAYLNGYQSCMMAPTEILSDQHYETMTRLLSPLGVRVANLKGSLNHGTRSRLDAEIAAGEYDLVVGTHALISSGTAFDRLALVITDEQHRFGVGQRDALAKKGINPHRLVMSATPIPRTLALMIYGELDISVLGELPRGRKQIKTYAVTGRLRERAYAFIKAQLDMGRQAYFVCPAVEDGLSGTAGVTGYSRELREGFFRDYRIGVLHGRLQQSEKERVMAEFKSGELDILVATTVVEVGVDVPNATVMLVESADRFGLSQLHQLRGRVGRGEHSSYCILISDSRQETARERLRALASTSDGFEISELDLRQRGPGDFFGQAQHGLPRLKLADAAADRELVELSVREAEGLFARLEAKDSDSPWAAALMERVDALFDSEGKS